MTKGSSSAVLIRLGKIIFPPVLGLGVYGILGFIDSTWIRVYPLLIAYFFPPFGKETVIPLGVGVLKQGLTIPFFDIHVSPLSVHPVAMALSVAFIDIVVALFLVWNYDLAKKIPVIGSFIIKVEDRGKGFQQRYSWVKPLRFIGVILFVIIPFQGSGGLVGSIVGRLIGMKPWSTFLAISIGAVTGCLLIATFATAFLIFAEINTVLTLVLVIIIVIIVAVYFMVQKRKKKRLSH